MWDHLALRYAAFFIILANGSRYGFAVTVHLRPSV